MKQCTEGVMIEVEVCERLMDCWYDNGVRKPKYHAQVKNQPGLWACAEHPHDAIGRLVANHPEVFGLKITHLEGPLAR